MHIFGGDEFKISCYHFENKRLYAFCLILAQRIKLKQRDSQRKLIIGVFYV